MNDELFGVLSSDERIKWWKGTAELSPNKKIEVYLREKPEAFEKKLPAIKLFFKKIALNELTIEAGVAAAMLKMANNWREDDAPEETLVTFKKKIEPQSVVINLNDDLPALLYFSDGDLFAGHTIVARLDDKALLVDANISG